MQQLILMGKADHRGRGPWALEGRLGRVFPLRRMVTAGDLISM